MHDVHFQWRQKHKPICQLANQGELYQLALNSPMHPPISIRLGRNTTLNSPIQGSPSAGMAHHNNKSPQSALAWNASFWGGGSGGGAAAGAAHSSIVNVSALPPPQHLANIIIPDTTIIMICHNYNIQQ